MEEKYVIINILTRDCLNDDMYFTGTVNSFLENTNFDEKINIHVYHNGNYESVISKTVNSFVEKHYDKALFSVRLGGENRGIEFGVDTSNEWVGEYKYCLFTEGEWITITENKNWLNDSLKFMEENQIDQLILHPYDCNEEDIEKEKNGYVFLKEFKHTNKPHIRKNKAFYDNGVFPLQEYDGKTKQLKSAWLKNETMIPCEDFLNRMKYTN